MQPLLDAIATMALPSDAQRVFHGRGGLHPGCQHWSLDWLGPVWLATSFEPVDEADLARLHSALAARWAQLGPGQALNWVFQLRHGGRCDTRLMAGTVPEPHEVAEDGARYRVHLLRGQNHGLFFGHGRRPALGA